MTDVVRYRRSRWRDASPIKQRLIGTRAGSALRRMAWWAALPQRIRHPELWDLYLEDQRTSRLLEALIQPDWNCVDVGAHLGSTLHRLVQLAPNGRHVAVEPTPEKAAWLRRRYPAVTIVEAAACDRKGTATFHHAARSGYSGLGTVIDSDVVMTYPVKLVRLDAVVDHDVAVDFLKIDTEGSELQVFHGAERILGRDRPVLLFECGPHIKTESQNYTRVDLFDFLIAAEYRIFSVADALYHRPPLGREEFDRAGLYPYRGFNYLALPPGSELPG